MVKKASNPDVVREIQIIAESSPRGGVTPSVVVHRAEDPSSALHSCFEWDDSKAAHEHRLGQARAILRNVRIVYEGVEQQLVHVPSVMVEDEDSAEDTERSQEGMYLPCRMIAVEDELDRAIREITVMFDGLGRRLDWLRDLASDRGSPVSSAVDRTIRDLGRASRRLRKSRSGAPKRK